MRVYRDLRRARPGPDRLAAARGQDRLAARDHPIDVRHVLEVALDHVGVQAHVPAEPQPWRNPHTLADHRDTR